MNVPLQVTLGEIAVVGGPVYFDPGSYHNNSGLQPGEWDAYIFSEYGKAFMYAAKLHNISSFYKTPTQPSPRSFSTASPFGHNNNNPGSVKEATVRQDDKGNFYYTLSTGKEPISNAQLSNIATMGLDLSNPHMHRYEVKSTICYTSNPNCTPMNVYDALKKYPAPFVFNANGVAQDEVSHVTGFGPVRHVVNAENLSVTNVTLGNHELHPGLVFQQIYKDGEEIGVRTIGIGTGAWGWQSEVLAPVVWGFNGIMIRSIFESNQEDVFRSIWEFGYYSNPVGDYAQTAPIIPDASLVPAHFNPFYYLAGNPGLAAALGTRDAAAATNHYINYGRFEGLSTSNFHGLEYIASHWDLIPAYGVDGRSGAFHYMDYGMSEGRTTTFDSLRYIASWGDLIQAYGANIDSGAYHYIKYGFNEGWRSTTFDPFRYGSINPDVQNYYGGDADAMTIHYIVYGYREGRDTGAGQPRAAPIAIDLDGDGIEIITLDLSNATFDFNETGNKLPTAWVASDDGILVIDLDEKGLLHPDNQITSVDEISFSIAHAKKNDINISKQIGDLPALDALYNTNSDDRLDALDANWDSFRVWKDFNQNGTAEIGELRKLSELGIESISLRAEARSDVFSDGSTIKGLASAENMSGAKHDVADIEFAYGTLPGSGVSTPEQIANVIDIKSRLGLDELL